MKIGYDISQTFSSPAGCGYYARIFFSKLIENSDFNIIPYASFGSDFYDIEFNKIARKKNKNYLSHTTKRDNELFWSEDTFNIDNFNILGKPNIIHSNNFYFPPTSKFCRNIYTLYDMSFFDNPAWNNSQNWYICSKGVFNASLYADHIVTISEFSRERFLYYYPNFNSNNISIIYPTSRFTNYKLPSSFVAQNDSLRNYKFFLVVGTLEPRKNHLSIIKAFSNFIKKTNSKKYKLVFVGGYGWKYELTKKFISELNLVDKIIFTGYVDDANLYWYYKNCELNIYFSYYEGFGMPVLEALSIGALTVASNIPVFRELFKGMIIHSKSKDEISFLEQTMYEVHKNKKHLTKKFENKKALKKFDLDQNYLKLIKLYKDIN